MRSWALRAVVVALALALLEIALLLPVFPAAASTASGLLHAYIAIARIYCLVTLPLGLLLGCFSALWRKRAPSLLRGTPLQLPEPAWVLSLFLSVVVGSALLRAVTSKILGKEVDFPETRSGLLLLAGFLILGFTLLFERIVLRTVTRKLVHNMPQLGQPAAISTFALVLLSTCSMVAAHTVLAPVHLVTLCAVCGVIAAVLGLLAAGLAWQPRWRWVQIVTATVGALLLLTIGLDRNPTGRFVLYGPASTAGPLAATVRRALDADGDGASPLWAGGTDCAEGDPSRGPHRRELPADGIDQDCRGGDAKTPPGQAAVTLRDLSQMCVIPNTYRSVLLITIDALRADAPTPKIMPNLVALAHSSLIFDRAYSPSTMTGPSLAALFAGRTIADLHPDNVSSDEPITVTDSLAQRFKAAGYRTVAFNRVALKTSSFSGFDKYNPYPTDVQPRGKGQLLAAGMVNGALSYMKRSDTRPFFVWIHFLDTHAPYSFDSSVDLSPQQLSLSPYERGAQYVDAHLGRLLRELTRSGLLRHTLVAVTADHGEEDGSRARLGHGPYLFEDVIHVPLVLASPDCKASVVREPVSLAHLGQTLRELSGISAADTASGAIIEAPPQLPVVVEEAPVSLLGFKRAVISGQLKLLVDVMNGGRMLFDLAADPAETRDLYTLRPDLAQHMEATYQTWLDRPEDR